MGAGEVSQTGPNKEYINSKVHFLRWIVISIAGFGIMLSFIARLGISVAIVNMVNQTALYLHENPDADASDIAIDEQTGVLVWDNLIQSVVINTYFLGYGIPQVSISRVADRYGVMTPTILSTLSCIVCCALIPLSTIYSWKWTTLLRFLLGVSNAAIYPIAVGLIDTWIPASENTAAIGLLQSFGLFGYIVSPILSGYLCAIDWAWVFYASSIMHAVWLVAWILLVKTDPQQSSLMSAKELSMIVSERNFKADQSGRLDPPWGRIFTSWRFYLSLVPWVCLDGATITFVNLMPTYFRVEMLIDIRRNGTISMAIQMASLIGVLYGSWLTTYLINKRQWSNYKAFIIIYFIAASGSSFFWCLPIFVNEYQLIFFMLIRAFHPAIEFAIVGSVINEWAPSGLSGTIFGLYNACGTGSTIFFTCTSGYFLDASIGTSNSFAVVFAALGVVTMIGWLTFVIQRGRPTVPDKGDEFSDANKMRRLNHSDSFSLDRPAMLRSSSFAEISSQRSLSMN